MSKITNEQVNDFISRYEIQTIGEKTTAVTAVLVNGFEITKTSSCVKTEDYDQEIGAEFCKKQIEDEVWYLLGFSEHQKEYERKQIQKGAN